MPVYSRFLFAPSDNSFDPSRHVTHQDIKFTTSGAVLRIKCSKTLQHKEGILMIQLPNVPNSILCQLSASQHYFRMVPSSPTAPFFCLPATFTASSQFCSTLKRLVSRIGLDPADYSPHSFRCRGATFAFQARVPDHLIKLHGDWRADAYQAYLTLPLAMQSCVANIMATSMSPVII